MRIAVAALAFVAAVSAYQAEAQDCRLVSFGEVPISRAADGTGRLTVMLNGKPEEVSLDFAKPFSRISRAKATELNASINNPKFSLFDGANR
ncbi:MAG TPA: hypothetical protein VKQ29_10370 [Aliidongia sp.]|nr:hypothetical protein [Aliidongia sp.]